MTTQTAWTFLRQLLANNNRESTAISVRHDSSENQYSITNEYWLYRPETNPDPHQRTESVLYIYNGAPVCEDCASFLGRALANPESEALKRLAPRISYISNWRDIPGILADAPSRSILMIGGTDDDLSAWAPGGSQAMTTTSILAIREWVRNGGRYLGICGGAIVAPARYTDDESGLDFMSLGLAPINADNFPQDTWNEHIEQVMWKNHEQYGIYFQSGNYLTMLLNTPGVKASDFEVQGTYLATNVKRNVKTGVFPHDTGISTLQYQYGAGKVYLSGVHLEATKAFWDAVPNGFVAHTELLEEAIVDLLSTRVIGTSVPQPGPPGVTHINGTRRMDRWSVPETAKNVLWAEAPKELNTVISNAYPQDYTQIDQVPVIKISEKMIASYMKAIQFITETYFKDIRIVKTGLEGIAGSPQAVKVIIQLRNDGNSTQLDKPYRFVYTPCRFLDWQGNTSGLGSAAARAAAANNPDHYSICSWKEATHVRITPYVFPDSPIVTWYDKIPTKWLSELAPERRVRNLRRPGRRNK